MRRGRVGSDKEEYIINIPHSGKNLKRWLSNGEKWLHNYALYYELMQVEKYRGDPFSERLDCIRLLVQMDDMLNHPPDYPEKLDSNYVVSIHQALEFVMVETHHHDIEDLQTLANDFHELLIQIKRTSGMYR
jgi:hypothetical protein